MLCLLRLVSVWGGLPPPPSLTASRAWLCFAVLCLALLSFALVCAPLIRLRCLPACFALLDFAASLALFCLLASSLSCACLLPACSVLRNDLGCHAPQDDLLCFCFAFVSLVWYLLCSSLVLLCFCFACFGFCFARFTFCCLSLVCAYAANVKVRITTRLRLMARSAQVCSNRANTSHRDGR